ncbi:GyrI-like domain-containing protein [Lysinibacillus sp. SGAir0095]|uniref:AraC family transcriptional regulator n=1 Tax=Lysinibacillus sp. SGAir0095 TaxID=2070463 RepID=UPI0010CCC777|nr:AraC family transcriptional regulator [Lysinibacillus sp. SGAir0095]QCR33861.1 AraC family transcriptional regulator [Lysinibacillus sp. SGAir0095]
MLGNEQQKQIDRVLEYIDEHLNESLPLEKLAKVSTYSVYHFQRTFKAMTGETPSGYIKRLRLENSAHYLIYEQQIPITQIAMMCGFSSLSYFTYSFNEYFKTSPKKWRERAYLERFPREYQDSKKSKVFSNNKKDGKQVNTYNDFRWLDLTKVKTIDFPVCATVNRQNIGPYTQGIPETWEDIYHWSKSRELLKQNSFIFGVPRNNPYITPPDKSRYDCRIAINEEDFAGAGEELIYEFKGGKHVVYEFDEPVMYAERSKLIECYSELYSYWLPKSGYRYLGNPIELVELEPIEGSLSIECKIKKICLAIEPK